jgi:hypothetical protein
MSQFLFAAMLLAGAVLLAVWADLRLARAAPAAGPAVLLHLGAGVLAVAVAPEAMVALGDNTWLALVGVLGVFLPALVYLFLSSIWLLRLLQRTVARSGH